MPSLEKTMLEGSTSPPAETEPLAARCVSFQMSDSAIDKRGPPPVRPIAKGRQVIDLGADLAVARPAPYEVEARLTPVETMNLNQPFDRRMPEAGPLYRSQVRHPSARSIRGLVGRNSAIDALHTKKRPPRSARSSSRK